MARPRTSLPPGARDLLLKMAANGLRETVAARALGMKLSDFQRVIEENDYAKETWQTAKAIERDLLLDSLFNRAIEGDAKAAQFLLAARHNLSDKAPETHGERVNITFQLPAAMDAEKYLRAIQPQPQALEESPL